MKMTETQYQQFLGMSSELSPENLHCDGEISNADASRKYRDIMKRWHKLEKEVGRKVTEDEVWQIQMKRYEEGEHRRHVNPIWNVTLTRDTTESVTLTIEAETWTKAEEKALEQAGKYGTNINGWKLDEGNMHPVYPTGVEEAGKIL